MKSRRSECHKNYACSRILGSAYTYRCPAWSSRRARYIQHSTAHSLDDDLAAWSAPRAVSVVWPVQKTG